MSEPKSNTVSDTPRTDKAVELCHGMNGAFFDVNHPMRLVKADFARTLERELTAAKDMLDLVQNLRCEKCGHPASMDDICGHCLNAITEGQLAAMTTEKTYWKGVARGARAEAGVISNDEYAALCADTKARDYHRKACDIADQRDALRARVAELENRIVESTAFFEASEAPFYRGIQILKGETE